jgi:hypothetical protein
MVRFLSVGLLVSAVAVFGLLPAFADDIKDGVAHTGKIAKVDTTKREITLTEVKADKAPADKAPADKATADKGIGNYVFAVSADATITLDGSKADFKDLKEGLWAKCHCLPGEKATASDKDAGPMKCDRVEAFTKAPAPTKDK